MLKSFLISEDSILEYCDPSSWSRGQNYFKSKMIYDATSIYKQNQAIEQEAKGTF
jgi:hypothetical protein